MVPLFAAYIAYSIGDKPALVPALVCGWIINDNNLLGVNIDTGGTGGIVMPIEPGAGFIGALIVGFIVGYLVKYIRS
jgi:PTS system mannose-specific IIC component